MRGLQLLPGEDSNPHIQNQNLQCYRYTTGKYELSLRGVL